MDLRAFSGNAYQRGSGLGNVLRGLFKFLAPVAKKTAISIGKNALGVGLRTAQDLLNDGNNNNIKSSFIKNARKAGSNVAGDLLNDMSAHSGNTHTNAYKRKRKTSNTNTRSKHPRRGRTSKKPRVRKDIFNS